MSSNSKSNSSTGKQPLSAGTISGISSAPGIGADENSAISSSGTERDKPTMTLRLPRALVERRGSPARRMIPNIATSLASTFSTPSPHARRMITTTLPPRPGMNLSTSPPRLPGHEPLPRIYSATADEDEEEDAPSALVLPYLGPTTRSPDDTQGQHQQHQQQSSSRSHAPPITTSHFHPYNNPARQETSDDSCSDNNLSTMSNHTAASYSSMSISAPLEQFISSDTENSNNDSLKNFFQPSHPAHQLLIATTPLQPIPANPTVEILESSNKLTALNVMMEHRVFLKAALALLQERDRQAPELGMLDPVILKAGPLKKAAHLVNGIWKVKYVEIRRGMFSYYENFTHNDTKNNSSNKKKNKNGGVLLRKNIPLEASTCTCRPVKLHQKALNFTPLGAIFELSTFTPAATNNNNNNTPGGGNTAGGGNTGGGGGGGGGGGAGSTKQRLWMANTREERHAWMHAIQQAMVGGSVTRGDYTTCEHTGLVNRVSPKSPFRNDLRQYVKTQAALRQAKSMNEYVLAMRELLNRSLQLPVKWIAKQAILHGDSTFREETLDMSIDQMWRDLQRDTVQIDDHILRGDSGHGVERIIGALMRRLLLVSRSSKLNGDAALTSTSRSLSESQALAYARDVLLAGNRTRTGGDSYFCLKTLVGNNDLVVIVPSARVAEPVIFEVTEDQSEQSFSSRLDSKSGWIKTRNLLNRTWKRRYFVLSEGGTLSYYEGAHPRPHGLRGQIFVKDAVITVKKRVNSTGGGGGVSSNQFILSIIMSGESTTAALRETLLLFESPDLLIDWIYALECAVKSKSTALSAASNHNANNSNNNNKGQQQPKRRKSTGERGGFGIGIDLRASLTAAANAAAAAASSGFGTSTSAEPVNNDVADGKEPDDENNNTFTDLLTLAQQATLEHAAGLGMEGSFVVSRLERISRKTSSVVSISLRACTEYKICTTDPQGQEEFDTWATIRTHFMQTIRVTGGANGRITRGEETVRVSVVDCLEGIEPEEQPSKSPARRGKNRLLFRTNNVSASMASSTADAVSGLDFDDSSTQLVSA